MEYADKHGNKLILESRSKFLLVHASSGFKHALKEVLSNPSVAAALSDTKVSVEKKKLKLRNHVFLCLRFCCYLL